ncbi:MAG: 16S rRNA processing protein RimM [Clostridia bacterium]|nr:16S rRNA processing protein RimM [Clostridia bacterium]MBR3680743.1 16S rRNA processing protein RimM [Clostridia bacterium]
MKKIYLECGKVCAAHGVRGVLKVEPWCDSPRVLAMQKRIFLATGDGKFKEVRILTASVSAGFVLMSLEGVDGRDAAIAMKGTVLYLHRDDIPVAKGEMLLSDMIGLDVIDASTGERYGVISDITEVPRGLLYTVQTEKGEVLYPSADALVAGIDSERGLLVTPISGFFD